MLHPALFAFAAFPLLAGAALAQPGEGRGGPIRQDRQIVDQFDADGNGRLDRAERMAARAFLEENPTPRPGRRPGAETAQSRGPGERVEAASVDRFPGEGLYEPSVLRTFFLDFEYPDWEAELEEFYGTDVEVPATLMVDGQRLEDVGVGFRGASSFFMHSAGTKRSFNISLDFVHGKQRLHGVRTLNLLNGHGDPSFMSTLLYSGIARQHIPAPEANFVRVVVNGENWGVYVSAEQFNSDFERKHWQTSKGARWKVEGSPNGSSGLEYIGDDLEPYKRKYEMKAGNEEDWRALVALCRTLSTVPLEKLEEELRPHLDIEGALWFLALENALVNSDGYWSRASDYSIYRDPEGVFHIIPHDMNEAFSERRGGPPGRGRSGPDRRGGPRPGGEGPGPGGGRPSRGPGRGGGPTLEPFVALDDADKPLCSRLLRVPALRERYLQNMKWIAEVALSPERIGPEIARYRALIEEEMRKDTRLTSSYEAFDRATSAEEQDEAPSGLLRFAAERRRFLLEHPEIRGTDEAGSIQEDAGGRPGGEDR